jgi:hypothetical protein
MRFERFDVYQNGMQHFSSDNYRNKLVLGEKKSLGVELLIENSRILSLRIKLDYIRQFKFNYICIYE